MYRRLYAPIAALTALSLASGCTQMTRHSNMVVFGTNTVVGLRVGTAATEVPSIEVGFARQEAVLMPVVANTGSSADAKTLVPCNIANDVKVVAGTPAPPAGQPLPRFVTPPCLLVATNEGTGAKDSYSVLASFGANFGASAQRGDTGAKGGVAQYFATGLAAQLLALNGGASVVAAGDAADSSAKKAPLTLDGKSAITPTPEQIATAKGVIASYDTLRDVLAGKVRATQQGDLAARFATFQGAIGGSPVNILGGCASPDSCAARITQNYYFSNYADDPGKFGAAVTAWPTN